MTGPSPARPDAQWRDAESGRLADAYGAYLPVLAVAVGEPDPGDADLALAVYLSGELGLTPRATVAADGAEVELDNRFWESSDAWTDAGTGAGVEVVYRQLDEVAAALDLLLVRHEVRLGGSTTLWHELRTCEVLVDPEGELTRLQAVARQPYPEGLRLAILAKNTPVLRSVRSSYAARLTTAVRRQDPLGVGTGVAGLLSCVLEVVLAVNRETQPPRGPLLAYAQERCRVLPRDFTPLVADLLAAATPGPGLLPAVDGLLDALQEMLVLEGLRAAPLEGRWSPR